MWGSIIEAVLPAAFWLINRWMKAKDKEDAMVKSYYEFLSQVDKSGAAKVANYLSAEQALKAKQDELTKELNK